MKLEMQKMSEISIDAHVNLVYTSRQNSPLRSDERTIAGIKTAFEQIIEQGDSHVMIVAQDEGSDELLGQLLVNLDWGELGISSPWQPIIHPEANQQKVAIALIEHSKTLLKTHSVTRLEFWMELTNEKFEAMRPTFVSWYENSGFTLSAKEYFMDTQYDKLLEKDYSIPEGIEVVSMSELANEDLMDIVLNTFRSSSDKWFMSMTESQQEGSAKLWLKTDETLHNDASIVFVDDGKIIGYNVMRTEDNSIEVGPIGVLPSHRGKGLGRALLLESTRKLALKDSQSIWLTVSTENQYAFDLYSSLGFENKYPILIYTWMP